MLNDPQSIKFGAAAATSLPRVPAPAGQGAFANPDNSVQLMISHQIGKRNRQTIRLRHAKLAVDPLTAVNSEFSLSATFALDTPKRGYTEAELLEIAEAFKTALTTDLIRRVLGGEA